MSSIINGQITLNEELCGSFKVLFPMNLKQERKSFNIVVPASSNSKVFRFVKPPKKKHLTARNSRTILFQVSLQLERLP